MSNVFIYWDNSNIFHSAQDIHSHIEGSDQVDITTEGSGTDVEEPKPGVDGRSTSSAVEDDSGNDGRSKTPRRGNRKTPGVITHFFGVFSSFLKKVSRFLVQNPTKGSRREK